MTPAQRVKFFKEFWPAACRTQHWGTGDEVKRHEAVATCMQLVRGPVTSSTKDLGPDEVTALFTYLHFLAAETLEASQRWADCQVDYHAFNRARQADWHEREMYGSRKNKLDRNRFAGATSAVGEPQEVFDPEQIAKRHLTMASRHQAKQRQEARTITAEVSDLEHVMAGGALDIPPGEDPF